MTGLAVIVTAVLSIGTVPIISLVKQGHWDARTKFLLSIGVSALIAVGQVIVNNHVQSFTDFAALWSVAVATTQSVYKLYFQNTTANDKLTAVGGSDSGA